jgi:hypothetical protein
VRAKVVLEPCGFPTRKVSEILAFGFFKSRTLLIGVDQKRTSPHGFVLSPVFLYPHPWIFAPWEGFWTQSVVVPCTFGVHSMLLSESPQKSSGSSVLPKEKIKFQAGNKLPEITQGISIVKTLDMNM